MSKSKPILSIKRCDDGSFEALIRPKGDNCGFCTIFSNIISSTKPGELVNIYKIRKAKLKKTVVIVDRNRYLEVMQLANVDISRFGELIESSLSRKLSESQILVEYYKYIKSLWKVNNWDRYNFPRFSRDAKELIALSGSLINAMRVVKWGSIKFRDIDWTIQALLRNYYLYVKQVKSIEIKQNFLEKSTKESIAEFKGGNNDQ